MPEIVQRLDQLSKSVGSFSSRCGLGWVLGGLAGTISSWAVPEKTAKNTRKKGDILGIKTTIVGLATSLLSTHGRCLKFLWYIPKTLNETHFFYFSKSWFVAEVQGFKVTPLLHVKSKLPIVWPGRFHTFCLRQMIEISVVYSKDPKLKTLFLFFKMLIRCRYTRVQSYPTSAHSQRYQLLGLATSILSVYGRCLKFCDMFLRS